MKLENKTNPSVRKELLAEKKRLGTFGKLAGAAVFGAIVTLSGQDVMAQEKPKPAVTQKSDAAVKAEAAVKKLTGIMINATVMDGWSPVDPNSEITHKLAGGLDATNPDTLKTLISMMDLRNGNMFSIGCAGALLESIGFEKPDIVVPFLRGVMKSGDKQKANSAICVLRGMSGKVDIGRYEGLVEELGGLLRNEDTVNMTAEAFVSIAGRTDLSAYPKILDTLESLMASPNAQLSNNAGAALGATADKNPKAVMGRVEKALGSGDGSRVSAAINAISAMSGTVDLQKYPRIMKGLGKLVADQNWAEEVTDVLRDVAQKTDLATEPSIMEGLAVPLAMDDEFARQALSSSIMHNSKAAMPYVLKLLKNNDPHVRAGAAGAVGDAANEMCLSGYETLMNKLGKLLNDPDTNVKKEAAYAIENIAKSTR